MLPLLRTAAPVTLKLSPPSHQLSPYPPLGKRVAFAVALIEASNSSSTHAIQQDHPRPATTRRLKEAEPLAPDTQRLSLLIRPLPASHIQNPDTCSEPAASDLNTVPTAYSPRFSFPVFGPFDLLYCMQNGGFGSAWAAKDQSTGQLLCLKVFRSLKDPDVTRSVQTELRTFRRMVKSQRGERGKQFIMELSRSIQHDTTVLFAMELMTTDLGTYMYTEPERCTLHARQWMAQMALGIESLHEMGILHRDIKCENILIDCRENVRIIDFGLSYLNPTGKPLRQGGEYAIEFLGTVPYMAPEVLRNKGTPVRGRKCYGAAVDWWALGCILFELESQGHQPLFNTEEDVHAYVDWTQTPRQLGQIYTSFEGLDSTVLSLVEGLLQVQPSTRYSLNDLEKHDYFLLCNGSEFDNTAARALERPICPELVPQFAGDHGPIEIVESAKLSSVYDWTNLKWACLLDN